MDEFRKGGGKEVLLSLPLINPSGQADFLLVSA